MLRSRMRELAHPEAAALVGSLRKLSGYEPCIYHPGTR